MPNYTSNAQATLLYENTQKLLWNNETVTPPQLSIAFEIRRVLSSYYPWGVAVEVQFGSDPGTFELDIMGAETDEKPNYIKLDSIATVNSSYVGRWDSRTVYPKYIAVELVTLTNAVPVTVKLTR